MSEDMANGQRAPKQSSTPNELPSFSRMQTDFLQAISQAQKEIITRLGDANRRWVDRLQAETDLASEVGNSLMAVRSAPETITICGKWMSRRIEIAQQDGQRLLADSQKLAELGTRLAANGWLTNGHSAKP